jgi:hypothetical protein
MPSPDVAKAMAQSFAASGDINVNIPPTGTTPEVAAAAAGALSQSRSEAMAQLTQRLATIQLLRDGLYRACEAYANGAINDTTYAVMLSRFDDTMITMLLGEFASGMPAGKQATISTSSSGESSSPPAKASGEPAAGAAGETRPVAESDAEAPSATSQASATASAGEGQGAGGSNAAVAHELAEMQRRYIQNVNFDALMVACIHTLSHPNTPHSPLARLCEEKIPPMIVAAGELLLEYKKRSAAAHEAIAEWKTVEEVLAGTKRLVKSVKELEAQDGN